MPGGNSRLSKMGHQRQSLSQQTVERSTEPYAGPEDAIRPNRAERQVAIFGASSDRAKFGNKAVRAYTREGYTVWPVNPKGGDIEGQRTFRSVEELPDVPFLASVYLHENEALDVLGQLGDLQRERGNKIAVVYLNPGVTTPAIAERAAEEDLYAISTCSIRAIGQAPDQYPEDSDYVPAPTGHVSAEEIERDQMDEAAQLKVPVGHATPRGHNVPGR